MVVVLTLLRRPGKGRKAQAGRVVLPFISCSAERKWLRHHTGHAGATAISSAEAPLPSTDQAVAGRSGQLNLAPLTNLPVTLGMPLHE